MLDRYLRNEATEEEVKLLDKFYEKYVTEVEPDAVDPKLRLEILQHVHQRIQPPTKFQKVPIWLKVAASVALLVIATTAYFKIQKSAPPETLLPVVVTESTVRGVKSQIALPDGSVVHLNSESAISFPSTFEGKIRPVTLTGEAYFEVSHDPSKPFIVHTATAITKVLGTSFNVHARDNENVEITLVDGSVNVALGSSNVFLRPGEQASVGFTNQTITRQKVNVTKYIAWKKNILHFEQTRLIDAVATLESWYDVDITVQSQSLNGCLITAQYQNESLKNVLKSFQFLLGAKVTYKSDTTILITGNRCK